VVFTSSSLHTTAPSTVKFESREEINKDIGPNNLYAKSKLANLFYAIYLAKEVVGENVYINAVHPGAVKTGIPLEDSYSSSPRSIKFLFSSFSLFPPTHPSAFPQTFSIHGPPAFPHLILLSRKS